MRFLMQIFDDIIMGEFKDLKFNIKSIIDVCIFRRNRVVINFTFFYA